MKNRIVAFISGCICAIVVMLVFFTLKSLWGDYKNDLYAIKATQIIYQGNTIETHLSPDVQGYLADGELTRYRKKLPSGENAMRIAIPHRAVLYVYPLDDDSMLIEYFPRDGISRTFKKSGYGDFNRLLRALYECTENEVFHTAVEY